MSHHRVNSALGFILLLIVALAPIPLGSNRPVFWLLWTIVIFTVCAVYLGFVSISGLKLRNPFHEMPVVATSAVLFVTYAIVQAVPIGTVIPNIIDTQAGSDGPGFISLSRDATMVAGLRWASYAVFFFLLLQVVENRARARRFAWYLFLIVATHAMLSLISYRTIGDAFFWGPKTAYIGYLTGTFVNRNSFATFVGFGAVLGFSLLLNEFLRGSALRQRAWLQSVEGIKTALLWLVLALCLSVLFSTGSRMGVAATMAALFAVIVLTIRKHHASSRGFVLGIIGIFLLIVILMFAVFGSQLLDRSIYLGPAWVVRLELFEQIIGLIKSRPVLGYGLDAFELAYEHVHRPPVSPDLVWARAHSTYLAHWTEMGIIVGSLPLVICGNLAVRMLISFRSKKRDYVLEIAGLGALTLAGVHSLVDFSLEISANVFLFLALLSVALPPKYKTQAAAVPGERAE